MLELFGASGRRCDGLSRRGFLQVGSVGLAGLTLADVLRARANAGGDNPKSLAERSVILIWLDGGPPQHETYDPKPDAPTEYRGPLQAIPTALPGVQVSELLPNHARLMDRMSIIRSLHHDNGDHFAAAHWMLTGYLGSNAINMAPQYPSAGSIVARLKGAKRPGIPAYVGLPRTHSVGLAPGYHGGAYLGAGCNPFNADGDPNSDKYQVPNLSLPAGVDAPRLMGRRGLLSAFDGVRRTALTSSSMEGLDRFEQEALDKVHVALRAVPPRYRSSYFSHIWASQYSAGYYAYLWTEMLADDAFQWFDENGGLTRANGDRFRQMILSRGNTEDLATLYAAWRGKDPSVQPMMKYRGLQ